MLHEVPNGGIQMGEYYKNGDPQLNQTPDYMSRILITFFRFINVTKYSYYRNIIPNGTLFNRTINRKKVKWLRLQMYNIFMARLSNL